MMILVALVPLKIFFVKMNFVLFRIKSYSKNLIRKREKSSNLIMGKILKSFCQIDY